MSNTSDYTGIEHKATGERIIRHVMAAIIHRGSDEQGILIAPPVAVGSRRLSIIDLPGGSQPTWNASFSFAASGSAFCVTLYALHAKKGKL